MFKEFKKVYAPIIIKKEFYKDGVYQGELKALVPFMGLLVNENKMEVYFEDNFILGDTVNDDYTVNKYDKLPSKEQVDRLLQFQKEQVFNNTEFVNAIFYSYEEAVEFCGIVTNELNDEFLTEEKNGITYQDKSLFANYILRVIDISSHYYSKRGELNIEGKKEFIETCYLDDARAQSKVRK